MRTDDFPVLTKRQLLRRMAALTGRSQVECRPWLAAVVRTLEEAITEADPEARIQIFNFGTFDVKVQAATPAARNPKKPDERYFVPAHRRVVFKPAKALRRPLSEPLDPARHDFEALGLDPIGRRRG